jgi:hypothetical protein
LIGVDPQQLHTSGLGLSAALKGFMRRAIDKANVK